MATLRASSSLRQLCNATHRSLPSTSTLRSISTIRNEPATSLPRCQHSTQPRRTLAPHSALTYQARTATTKSTTQETPQTNTPEDASLHSKTPDITNHYTVFPQTIPHGPPPHSPFAIPQSNLRREFLHLQNLCHPDKYPNETTKAHAEALSARINEAYRTLLDPLSRAQYLLREFHHIDVTSEDTGAKQSLDPEMLMDVMSVQETVEEVSSKPREEAVKTVERLRGENSERVDICVKDLGNAFDRDDIEGARKETVRLRFWYSLGGGLKEWEPGMAEIRLVH